MRTANGGCRMMGVGCGGRQVDTRAAPNSRFSTHLGRGRMAPGGGIMSMGRPLRGGERRSYSGGGGPRMSPASNSGAPQLNAAAAGLQQRCCKQGGTAALPARSACCTAGVAAGAMGGGAAAAPSGGREPNAERNAAHEAAKDRHRFVAARCWLLGPHACTAVAVKQGCTQACWHAGSMRGEPRDKQGWPVAARVTPPPSPTTVPATSLSCCCRCWSCCHG